MVSSLERFLIKHRSSMVHVTVSYLCLKCSQVKQFSWLIATMGQNLLRQCQMDLIDVPWTKQLCLSVRS